MGTENLKIPHTHQNVMQGKKKQDQAKGKCFRNKEI